MANATLVKPSLKEIVGPERVAKLSCEIPREVLNGWMWHGKKDGETVIHVSGYDFSKWHFKVQFPDHKNWEYWAGPFDAEELVIWMEGKDIPVKDLVWYATTMRNPNYSDKGIPTTVKAVK